MGQWIVTVAGIAILAVFCDIILPEGQTRKYIKTVIGVVVTLVMIQPLLNIANGAFSFDSNSGGYSDVRLQESYLEMVDEKQTKEWQCKAQSTLKAYGIDVEVLEINKNGKKLSLKSASEFSQERKSLIEKVYKTYFEEYEITIKWKQL